MLHKHNELRETDTHEVRHSLQGLQIPGKLLAPASRRMAVHSPLHFRKITTTFHNSRGPGPFGIGIVMLIALNSPAEACFTDPMAFQAQHADAQLVSHNAVFMLTQRNCTQVSFVTNNRFAICPVLCFLTMIQSKSG